MAQVESAWGRYPGYRIDLVPFPGTARAWHDGVLLAESTSALRVLETDHVERVYFPESDVHFDLFEANDHHSICPFKGEADYWSLTATDPSVEDAIWTYPTPLDEVAGLKGHIGFYHERVRVELVGGSSGDDRDVNINRVPTWGDAQRPGPTDRRAAERPGSLRRALLPGQDPQRRRGRAVPGPGDRGRRPRPSPSNG